MRLRHLSAALALAVLCLVPGCKYALAPVLWVYELGHPPAECSEPLPGDGRGYQCDFTDAGTKWFCVAPSATLECDGGARSADWWPDSGRSTIEDVTDAGAGAGIEPGHGMTRSDLASPVLDSEPDLAPFRCLALGIAQGDVVDQAHVYGTFWPARCDADLPAGSILADSGRVLGCRTNYSFICWYADGGFGLTGRGDPPPGCRPAAKKACWWPDGGFVVSDG